MAHCQFRTIDGPFQIAVPSRDQTLSSSDIVSSAVCPEEDVILCSRWGIGRRTSISLRDKGYYTAICNELRSLLDLDIGSPHVV